MNKITISGATQDELLAVQASAGEFRDAHYDEQDILRLIVYRRAVRAGYFNESGPGQYPLAEQIANSTDWLSGFRSWAARQNN